ncbi:alkene reductase [Leptolyngbya sp. NK1-12]|uniref:Alkene reductase n=1 Tax=Leptolyngbya sp. NK1-12 TaxID=2547451 RepID=A0AA96WIL4_9CYAN|nr:alkene reductase [Leptolyngbya sp. NK1-12]WNZ25809.1 alkene reductase [Leptolyngbya sp. NK1-12]
MSLEQLFSPLQVGAIHLPNRIVMAPLTRGRAGAERIPNDLMLEYYALRAGAGLIITEATQISEQAAGWDQSPGIHTDAQVQGWQKITEAVHRQGGRIVLQLWHTGRASHPDFQPGGELPVSASAIAINGYSHTPKGKKPYLAPRPLQLDEIPGVVQQYATATRRAQDAGFDGVEIHAANGYLIDQFLKDGVNQRTDAYGGSIANRARFLLEVTEAVVNAWSSDRVGIKLSPSNHGYNDMRDSDPKATFTYVAEALNAFNLAFLDVFEPLPGHELAAEDDRYTPVIREAYNGVLVVGGGYDAELGEAAISNGEADLIAYGVPFIANPDLVERFRLGAALNSPDPTTFHARGEKGYLDYPLLAKV